MNLWAFKPLLFGYFTEGSDYFLTEFEAMVLLLVRYGISDFCDTKGLARQPGLFEVSPKQRITYTHRPCKSEWEPGSVRTVSEEAFFPPSRCSSLPSRRNRMVTILNRIQLPTQNCMPTQYTANNVSFNVPCYFECSLKLYLLKQMTKQPKGASTGERPKVTYSHHGIW